MKENTIYLKSQETQQVSVEEKLLAAMSLFMAYVFVRCFIPGYYGFLGMTVTLFTAVFALGGGFYFHKKGFAFTGESLYWLVMALALGGSYTLFVNQRPAQGIKRCKAYSLGFIVFKNRQVSRGNSNFFCQCTS